MSGSLTQSVGGAVGHPQRAARLEPGDGIDERVPVGLPLGVHAEAVDAASVGGDRVGQFGQRDLAAGPAQRGQREDQVGVAAAVEGRGGHGSARGGSGRACPGRGAA